MNKIATLTHQEEIELLHQAKKGWTEYDVLGVYHDASEEEIQKAFSNKIEKILKKYKSEDEVKDIKKDCKKQNYKGLLSALNSSLSKEGKKNKAEFEEVKKAYETLSNKPKKTIYDEENKDLFSARNRAIRLLIHYNQSFVKYWVSRFYYYSQNEVDSEDLVNVGITALLDAIKEFDLDRAKKYRLATYAGHFVRQRVNKFVKESQLTPKAIKKKVCDFCKRELKTEELKKVVGEQRLICSTCLANNPALKTEQKKIPARQDWSVIYYDKGYYESEKAGSSSLLSDTLKDDEDEEQIEQQQRENRIKIDSLLSNLEYPEDLIIRLYYGLAPVDLTQIYHLATEQKRQKIKKIEKNFSLLEKEFTPLIKKYWNFLSRPRKKEDVFQAVAQTEFWECFREFPELTTKAAFSPSVKAKKTQKMNQKKISGQSVKEKEWNGLLQTWINNQHTQNFSEKEIRRWISLGYQPEDVLDSRNLILQKLGISKKNRQEWEAKGGSKKDQDWFEFHLTKKIERWKKDSEKKLKIWKENK